MSHISPDPRTTCPAASAPRVLRAGERMHSPFDALALVMSLATWPLDEQTFVLVVDGDGAGLGVVSATGPDDPRVMIRLVDHVADAGRRDADIGAVVVASIRRCGSVRPGDATCWHRIDQICNDAGIELTEWFVIAPDAVACPRALAGVPDRWEH